MCNFYLLNHHVYSYFCPPPLCHQGIYTPKACMNFTRCATLVVGDYCEYQSLVAVLVISV